MSRHWACCLEWFRLICHHGHLFYFSISNLKIHYCGCVFSYYLLSSIETSKYSLNIYSNIQLRIWPIKKWIIKILTTKPKYISFHKLKIICLILGFFFIFLFGFFKGYYCWDNKSYILFINNFVSFYFKTFFDKDLLFDIAIHSIKLSNYYRYVWKGLLKVS